LRLRSLFPISLICLSFAHPSAAQSPTGTISGIVTDPSGATIASAEVIVVNDATRVQVSGKTNGEGIYVVPNLVPGIYRVQVSKIGFKTIIKPDIVVNVQDALAINFALPLGATSEIVTIQGGAPVVNTESAAVSTVIDRQFVENLPLNGRSFNTLLQLTPGVVIVPVPTAGFTPGQFSIAGQRSDANNFTVDGVSANFGVGTGRGLGASGVGTAQAFSALGGTSSLVSVEALQEFRVETSSVAPEFGRSPGGQVILNTRSGTNDLHGGIYEYFRNDVLDANNWFNDAASPQIRKAPERHNDFGGFVGGPILKSKTFFFASYEAARLRLPETQLIAVPSQFARSQASPTLAPFLNAYPLPNGQPASPAAYIAPFTGAYSNPATLNAGSVRVDHTINDRFSVFGRYNNAPSEIANRNNSLNTILSTTVNTQTLTIGVNMSLTNQVLNTLRGNYSTAHSASTDTEDSFGGAVPLDESLLLGGLPPRNSSLAFFLFDASTQFIGPNARNKTQQLNLVDDLSWTVGSHRVKVGEDYRAIYLDNNVSGNSLFFFSTNVQSFLSTGKVNFLETVAAAQPQVLTRSLSLYAQDAWKINPRLTFTYGLRWELDPAPSPRGTTTLTAWSNVDNPSALALAPPGTPLWETTYGNFAPRVGIAYRLTNKGDFVLRAGGGVFYDLGLGQVMQILGNSNNLGTKISLGVSVPVADATPFLASISAQPPFPSGTEGFSPNLKLPRSYQWNVALEKSVGEKQAVSATYVGQAGRDLLRAQALFQPNPSFSGDFRLEQNDAFSNYHALQLQYKRLLSSRVQSLLNYTWSHSLDNASDDFTLGLSNTIVSAKNDYASSSFDVRQSFSGAVTYAIPGVSGLRPVSLLTTGWSIDAVVVARSGFPFNATLEQATPDPGGTAFSRPDRVAGRPVWISAPNAPGGKTLNVAYDPTTGAIIGGAFSIPTTPRQGTEGRNDIPGFGFTQIDFSLGRKFSLTERVTLQFRTDAFNLFNHPNFTNPDGTIEFGPSHIESQSMLNQGLGGLNPLFQEGGPRSLQLSLELKF
jgi:hypothetical protein